MLKVLERLKYTFVYEAILPIWLRLEIYSWSRRKKTPPTPQLIKHKIIRDLATKYSLKILVETGTYLGVMINANKNYFERIFTIELGKRLYLRARRKFTNFKHIEVKLGDSAKILPHILKKIKGSAIFWLDAHYSGGITAKGETDTPVVSELKMILDKKLPSYVILIDDALEFNGKNDYPHIKEIMTLVKRNYNCSISVKNNIIHILPDKY